MQQPHTTATPTLRNPKTSKSTNTHNVVQRPNHTKHNTYRRPSSRLGSPGVCRASLSPYTCQCICRCELANSHRLRNPRTQVTSTLCAKTDKMHSGLQHGVHPSRVSERRSPEAPHTWAAGPWRSNGTSTSSRRQLPPSLLCLAYPPARIGLR